MEEFREGVGDIGKTENHIALNNWRIGEPSKVLEHQRTDHAHQYSNEYREKGKRDKTVEDFKRRPFIELTILPRIVIDSIEENDAHSIIGDSFSED